jgi:hypothetical protein
MIEGIGLGTRIGGRGIDQGTMIEGIGTVEMTAAATGTADQTVIEMNAHDQEIRIEKYTEMQIGGQVQEIDVPHPPLAVPSRKPKNYHSTRNLLHPWAHSPTVAIHSHWTTSKNQLKNVWNEEQWVRFQLDLVELGSRVLGIQCLPSPLLVEVVLREEEGIL